ncbi:MAG: hypothetical protein QOF02_610 [Blastocatellia bacterium]|jgi:hypothetical protein|nr:hypothetical protein [Blastocatellia bacterium]
MKKRLLYRLIAVSLAFVIGLGLTSIWKASRPMSLCELDANPAPYAGKTIRFRAVVTKTQNFILACSACGDTAAGASIDLDPSEVAKFPLPESFMSRDEANVRIYAMDAVIVGTLDSDFGPGCFGPKFHISNARVERVLSFSPQLDLQTNLQWTKSNSY